jgi:hypothetical protein
MVIVNTDEQIIQKRLKTGENRQVNMCLDWRMEMIRIIMRGIEVKGLVVPNVDKDASVAKSLEYYGPNVFAKGGDRVESNMPENELEVCKRCGIEIVYGVGGKLNSSRLMTTDRDKIYYQDIGGRKGI